MREPIQTIAIRSAFVSICLFCFVEDSGCTRQLPVVDDTDLAPAEPVEADQSTIDVAWKPSTVVLESRDMAMAQVHVTSDAIQIANPTSAMTALAPGDHVLVPGEGLFRVRSATPQDTGMLLTVEPGSLLDAADSGTITWKAKLDPSRAVAVPLPNADPNWVVDKDGFPAFSYSGMLGRIAASLSVDNQGERTHMVAKLEMPTKVKLTATADGWVTQGHVEGIYDFAGGHVNRFLHKLNGVSIEAVFTLTGGGQPFDEKIELPWGVYFPITVGGMPAFIGMSVKAVLQATTTAKDQVTFNAKLNISGDTGVDIKSDLPSVTGVLHLNEFTAQSLDYTTTVTSGLSAALEFPRYTFGMGKVTLLSTTPPDAAIGLYLATNFETIANAVVQKSSAGSMFCIFVHNNAEVKLGGAVKLFGLSFEKDTQLWFGAGPRATAGPDCANVAEP